MDTLMENMLLDDQMGISIDNKKISNMLFVDDVMTLA
jgi:hypothetical protein